MVTNGADSGPGSLRAAIAAADQTDGPDTIVFEIPGQNEPEIMVTTGDLFLYGTITLLNDRPGDRPVTIRTESAYSFLIIRTFYVTDTAKITLAGIQLVGPEGGIFNQRGELTLRECTIRGNQDFRGALQSRDGEVTLTNCTFEDNGSGQSTDGTVILERGTLTATSCRFLRNVHSHSGAIRYFNEQSFGRLTVLDCWFEDNHAIDTNTSFGGAITVSGPLVFIARSTFLNNSNNSGFLGGGYGGGAICGFVREFGHLSDCTFSQNQSQRGGAFFEYGTPAGHWLLTNNTFTENSADIGGAVYVENYYNERGSSVELRNCTFRENHAPFGGAIASIRAGRTTVSNCVFSRFGSETNLMAGADGGVLISAGNNLSNDDAGGDSGTAPGGLLDAAGDMRNTDPRLAPLADNDGPTQTCALLPGSPAIDSGNEPFSSSRDQRNFVRIGPSDRGAFEAGGHKANSLLANISTRMRVGTGDDVLISGLIITGTEPMRVLLRAISSSLSLPSRLANPTLTLYDAAGQLILSNDNWGDAPNAAEVSATGIAPSHNLESAILTTLQPGAYTAVLRGVNNTTGVALAEVYRLEGEGARLANISSRGKVLTGDNVMIGGFISQGPDNHRVLIRALGPSLPIEASLPDPVLSVHDSSGTMIANNNDWRDDLMNAAAVGATGLALAHPGESALVLTVPPGPYTAIVRGNSGSTGVSLLEVYSLD